MQVCVKLTMVLNIASDVTSIWIDFFDKSLGVQVGLFRIGFSIVIILNWSCKQNIIFLSQGQSTFFVRLAVNSMIFCFEVTLAK